MGYLISAISIFLIPAINAAVSWTWLFAFLTPGPIVTIITSVRLIYYIRELQVKPSAPSDEENMKPVVEVAAETPAEETSTSASASESSSSEGKGESPNASLDSNSPQREIN